jgi:gliding motility-associated-like protein
MIVLKIKTYSMLHYRHFLFYLFLISFPFIVFGQGKEGNIWFFGDHAGVDFNPGTPPVFLQGGQIFSFSESVGSSVISNNNGELLFYSNSMTLWNRNHNVMYNGSDMGYYCGSGGVIIPSPGQDSMYYYFNFFLNLPDQFNYTLQYSLIDMRLEGGLGGVVTNQKKIPIEDGMTSFITAVKAADNESYWVISHTSKNDTYHSFKVDATGININPIISAIGQTPTTPTGRLKVSPNGKYIAISDVSSGNDFVDVFLFNNQSGVIYGEDQIQSECGALGFEYSPDNTKFYVTGCNWELFQYDLTAGTPEQIHSSRIQLNPSQDYFVNGVMQLGPDGKIYVADGEYYLHTINEPNQKGIACNLQMDAVYLNGQLAGNALPTIMQSYLNDPVFNAQNHCLGDSTLFTIENTNGIDSVLWAFTVFPNTYTSTDINPKFRFPKVGNFPVSLTVYSGYLHKTVSKQVKITALPVPGLGPDIINCPATTATLNAVAGYPTYLWNGIPGGSSYIATQAGEFTVQVTDTLGCSGYDTLVFSYYPLPIVDESGLIIAPTTCGKETGAITGIKLSGQSPFAYAWIKNGSAFASTPDIYHLGTGLYEFKITDGYGCTNTLASYLINDAGNILIDTASATPELCSGKNGTLSITAISGLGKMLQYSIKSGNDTLSHWADGFFPNLQSGTYYAWVTDSSGCNCYYSTPLEVESLPAPVATAVSTPETIAGNDGTITVTASGTGLTYSLNGAAAVSSPYFTGLISGTYTISISNADGCSSQISVSVGKENGIMLHAIAADGSACLGNIVVAPLVANNFLHVKSFHAKLNYDPSQVIGKNYMNVNPAFDTTKLKVELFAVSGELSISWQGDSPVSLSENSTLLELGFSSATQGQSYLNWDFAPGACYFVDSTGDAMLTQLTKGELRVYSLPRVDVNATLTVCEGDTLKLSATHLTGTGNGEITWQWYGPEGFSTSQPVQNIPNALPKQSGTYQVSLSDTNQCKNTYQVNVTVIPTPVSGFSTETDTLYFDERIWLSANEGYASYIWNTNDTTNTILVSKEGFYKVAITTEEGCTTEDSVVMLYANVPLDMPNAFSPNGDKLNDTFNPVTFPEKIKFFSIYIYDRWGQQVFFSNNVLKGWDGTIKGSPAQLGSYSYVLKYGNPSGAVREKRGMVVVVR